MVALPGLFSYPLFLNRFYFQIFHDSIHCSTQEIGSDFVVVVNQINANILLAMNTMYCKTAKFFLFAHSALKNDTICINIRLYLLHQILQRTMFRE